MSSYTLKIITHNYADCFFTALSEGIAKKSLCPCPYFKTTESVNRCFFLLHYFTYSKIFSMIIKWQRVSFVSHRPYIQIGNILHMRKNYCTVVFVMPKGGWAGESVWHYTKQAIFEMYASNLQLKLGCISVLLKAQDCNGLTGKIWQIMTFFNSVYCLKQPKALWIRYCLCIFYTIYVMHAFKLHASE